MIDSSKSSVPTINKESQFNTESIKYEASSISDLSSEHKSRIEGERNFGETGCTEKSYEVLPENVSSLEGPSNMNNFLDVHPPKRLKKGYQKARMLSVGAVDSDVVGVELSPNKTSSGRRKHRRKPRMWSDPGTLATLLIETDPEYYAHGTFPNPFISDFGKMKPNVDEEDFKMIKRMSESVTEDVLLEVIKDVKSAQEGPQQLEQSSGCYSGKERQDSEKRVLLRDLLQKTLSVASDEKDNSEDPHSEFLKVSSV